MSSALHSSIRALGGMTRLIAAAIVMAAIGLSVLSPAVTEARAAGGHGIGPGLRLVMVDDDACVYCRKWDAEVGSVYVQSPVGKVAPLTRRKKRHSDLAPYEPLAYTPTFILVRDGAEIGRIVGYPGADFFWVELERLIAKSGPLPPSPAPGQPAGARSTTTEPRGNTLRAVLPTANFTGH